MELVECSNLPGDHWYSILHIRNENRHGFGNDDLIHIAAHYRYMFDNFKNYLLCVEDGNVIGFIGHVNNDIRIATRKSHQNKGVGKFMGEGFMRKFPDSFAKVKIDNEASRKLFERCGFKKKYYVLQR